ncbi:MAG: hypothetical protein L6R42_004481, partial [Xanthoria sp. 1 TBL-2021]
MLNILIASATLAVLAILAALNPGNVLQTIAAGVEHTFSPGAAWENPFTKTSFIDLADASVALFADHVWPALIPGSTGTGRPYVVDLSTLANLTELNTVNMSDPLVYVQMLRESMTWVDRDELAAHIDFVLHTIDSANDRYNASVEAKQLLEAKTEELNKTLAKYDELLVVCDNLRVQLSQKIQELENDDRKARESVTSRRELQNALHAKIVDYDKLDGKLGTIKGALLNSNAENGNLRNSLQEKTKGYDAVVKQLEQANT